jgi:hypothetical protein
MQTHSQPTQTAPGPPAQRRPVALDVAVMGCLVPRPHASWRVHSIFANACNFACGDRLVTLVAPRWGGGPTVLVLRHRPALGLDRLFEAGEMLSWHATTLRARHAMLRLEDAELWSPPPTRPCLRAAHIETNLAVAAGLLALHRRRRPSVIDDHCAPFVSTLARATRALDTAAALRAVEHLVGRGQGLTPAGDDFLVGWCAALDALATDPAQRIFRNILGAALRRLAAQTTPIAAHYLRLAAAGHYLEMLIRVRDALLCEANHDTVRHAVDTALGIGATSGADMLSGLLHATEAWLPGTIFVER